LFGGYGLALAELALVVFGAIECPPMRTNGEHIPGARENFPSLSFISDEKRYSRRKTFSTLVELVHSLKLRFQNWWNLP